MPSSIVLVFLITVFVVAAFQAWHEEFLKRRTIEGQQREEEYRHTQEVAALKDQRQERADAALRASKKDEKEQKVKTELGNWLVVLQDLETEISKIYDFKYDDNIEKENNDKIMKTVNEIMSFLDVDVSRAEAALFRDVKAKPLPPQVTFTYLEDRKRAKWLHLSYVQANSAQLKSIVERYINK